MNHRTNHRPHTPWHPDTDTLAAYAEGRAEPPVLWSTETHLAGCANCRARLPLPPPELWTALDAELDAPRPPFAERLLTRCAVPEHLARLLTATAGLRRSWWLAVCGTLTLAVALAWGVQAQGLRLDGAPLLLLALVPLLPAAGVALSYGPAVDPAHEITATAPMDGFRLLLIRAAAVEAASIAATGAAFLLMPADAVAGLGPAALGWLLPSLAVTLTGLALCTRIGPAAAGAVAGIGWLAVVLSTRQEGASEGAVSLLLTPAGQTALGAAALAAGVVVAVRGVRGERGTAQ